MISLLKTFGKGILYVIGAPFFIVALVIFGAVGFVAFVFQIFKSIIFFFTGQKFFPELPEDKKLRLMREAAHQQNQPAEQDNNSNIISPIVEEELPEPEPSPIFMTRNEPEPTIEETVFEDTSSLEDFVNDEEEEELSEPPHEEEEHTVLETNNEQVKEEEEFEELETYVPRSSTYSAANDDEEDNDTNSGVDINYDL